MSGSLQLTAEDFRRQPRGPYLLNLWHAVPRVSTPFGEFVVEAQTSLDDVEPPDATMIRQANKLAEFVRTNASPILECIFKHYQSTAHDKSWMPECGVPVGLGRDDLAPYLDARNLVVDRDRSEPTIYLIPRWDHEHAIYLAVRRGRVVSQDD